MSTKSPIVIDLDELENSSPLPLEKLIYREEYESLKEKIIENVEINKKIRVDNRYIKDNKVTVSRRLCFFIDGVRGSGKSTILRVSEKDLKSLKKTKIEVLASIDPTELGETENFFIHILGHVQKLLLSVKRENVLEENDKRYLKTAYECMQTMSRGLSLLVRDPDNVRQYDDANYLIQKSISECVSSSNLKAKFAELSEVLCKILNVDVLLVTLDDADMNFIKCRDVMETVRKYLLNPRMLFVFAGDLSLFSTVVREMQLYNFGELMLKYDTNNHTSLFKMVDNLEEQYIMKFFPVDNRMSLRGFRERLKDGIVIRYDGMYPNKDKYLLEFLEDCLQMSSFNIESEYVLGGLSIFSMRSLLQLLSYWARHIKRENPTESNAFRLCRGIRYATLNALMKYEIDDEISSDINVLLWCVLLYAKN